MSSIWDIISVPFGWVLRGCNWLLGNQYILALLLFAIIIEIVLLPFGIKQQKNSIKQAKLRPKEQAIRKKYAGRNDKPTQQKMTMEIQELYQKEGYNPMGGCLPLLIQFPIIIALYNIVMSPLKYICGLSVDVINQTIEVVKSFPEYAETTFNATRNIDLMAAIKNIMGTNPDAFNHIEGFAEAIPNVDALPNLLLFGGRINLGAIPSFTTINWLLIIPVLTFVVYFLSMKLTRKLTYQPMADNQAMGCSNNMMDIVMPLFSVYICFMVPAAIGVYWIFKSIIGVGKQWILKKAMPLPTFTEEDFKAAEKEMNTRADKSSKVAKSGKVVRSLHHIDDEDFEDTAEAARKRREALEAQEAQEAQAKANDAKSGLMEGVALKKDEAPARKEKKSKKSAMDSYRDSLNLEQEDASKDTNDENKTDGEES